MEKVYFEVFWTLINDLKKIKIIVEFWLVFKTEIWNFI